MPQVRGVWSGYLANATASGEQKPASSDSEDHGQGLGDADREQARRIISQFGGGYEVQHFAAFHIIDQLGRIRVTLDQDALPEEIVANVRILLAGR